MDTAVLLVMGSSVAGDSEPGREFKLGILVHSPPLPELPGY